MGVIEQNIQAIFSSPLMANVKTATDTVKTDVAVFPDSFFRQAPGQVPLGSTRVDVRTNPAEDLQMAVALRTKAADEITAFKDKITALIHEQPADYFYMLNEHLKQIIPFLKDSASIATATEDFYKYVKIISTPISLEGAVTKTDTLPDRMVKSELLGMVMETKLAVLTNNTHQYGDGVVGFHSTYTTGESLDPKEKYFITLDLNTAIFHVNECEQPVVQAFLKGDLSMYGYDAEHKDYGSFLKAATAFREDLLHELKDCTDAKSRHACLEPLIKSFKIHSGLDITVLANTLVAQANKTIIDAIGDMWTQVTEAGGRAFSRQELSPLITANLEHQVSATVLRGQYPEFERLGIFNKFFDEAAGQFTLKDGIDCAQTIDDLVKRRVIDQAHGLILADIVKSSMGIKDRAHALLTRFEKSTSISKEAFFMEIQKLGLGKDKFLGLDHLANVKTLELKTFVCTNNDTGEIQMYQLIGGRDEVTNKFILVDPTYGDTYEGSDINTASDKFVLHNSIPGPTLLLYHNALGKTKTATVEYDGFKRARDFSGSVLGTAGIIIAAGGAFTGNEIVGGIGLGVLAVSTSISVVDMIDRGLRGQPISALEITGLGLQCLMIGGSAARLLIAKSLGTIKGLTPLQIEQSTSFLVSSMVTNTGSYGFYLQTAYEGLDSIINKDPQEALGTLYNVMLIGLLKGLELNCLSALRSGKTDLLMQKLAENGYKQNPGESQPEFIQRVLTSTQTQKQLLQKEMMDQLVRINKRNGLTIPLMENVVKFTTFDGETISANVFRDSVGAIKAYADLTPVEKTIMQNGVLHGEVYAGKDFVVDAKETRLASEVKTSTKGLSVGLRAGSEKIMIAYDEFFRAEEGLVKGKTVTRAANVVAKKKFINTFLATRSPEALQVLQQAGYIKVTGTTFEVVKGSVFEQLIDQTAVDNKPLDLGALQGVVKLLAAKPEQVKVEVLHTLLAAYSPSTAVSHSLKMSMMVNNIKELAIIKTTDGAYRKMNEKELVLLQEACLIHDIGKLQWSRADVLDNPKRPMPQRYIDDINNGVVTEQQVLEEMPSFMGIKETMMFNASQRLHVGESVSDLIRNCKMSDELMELVISHHHYSDGSGYGIGYGSAYKNPQLVEIMKIVDIYNAVREARSYKPATALERTRAIVRSEDIKLDKTLLDKIVEFLE